MTTPGIGASGVMGVAFEILAPPTGLVGNPAAGGALTAGAYRYVITALSAQGETTISNEITVTTAAGNLTAALTWGAVTGATGYNVYRTAAGGGTGTELKIATLGVVTSYNDTAVGSPAGAFPTINTAGNPGTYVPPVKYIPFLSESLKFVQDTQWRRPIRNTPGLVGAVAGNANIEGDIEVEALTDTIIYFLFATRCTCVKSGAGPYTYTYTPSPVAIPARTLSVTIVRNGVVYGYTGVTIASWKTTVDNGMLKATFSCLGFDEAVQSAPVPTWPTSTPFGAGTYSVQIPTASQVFDTDKFDFESNDNGSPQFRMKSTGRGAQFINFGESEASISVERDFMSRTDYDAFKALTAQSLTLLASKGASESVTITGPVSIKDTYEVGLSAQGDLVRASVAYQLAIDGTGKHYQVVVVTPTENIS